MSDKLVLWAGLNDGSRASMVRRLGVMQVDPRPRLHWLESRGLGGAVLDPLAGEEGEALAQEIVSLGLTEERRARSPQPPSFLADFSRGPRRLSAPVVP